ncbi:DNA polymerase III subunit delta' [Hoeflea prorocentri]|uniref:DNA polymerase III subunit delta n=1 Tax=Hoeflea prorocentri TaxID=1922333 RepID=A0A9X3ZH05_9HYPH|nr:DNA polymerase III subunit delta' [Hoeflea prorocentri]MCY6380759.1 DNA polymerase III subunit delta' [Hoeflea prorocentri]MDA5398559.1 DNA polymerase III subunit delta' [Hoeflea prorocentri]
MNADTGVLDGAIPPSQNTRLFGHEQACAFLADAYRSDHLHHAILLEGPEGIGKATLAYRFAYHLLMHEDPKTAPAALADPDLASPVIRQVAGGASHNLLHLARPLDTKTGRVKSAITVDEVRRAGHFLSQTSGSGNWRIVIVDPADDMNRSAANAILKILEEPPKKSLFLVLSHAPGKLLPTIRSRCMPLRLTPLNDQQMREGLAHLELSDHQEPQIVDAVIRHSEGSLSNAILLLRYGGLEIAEAFEQILKDGPERSQKKIHTLADSMTARDRETAYAFFTAYAANRLVSLAREAAADGDLHTAQHWASASSGLQENLAIADGYNLDRKQTILSVFSSVFRMPAA